MMGTVLAPQPGARPRGRRGARRGIGSCSASARRGRAARPSRTAVPPAHGLDRQGDGRPCAGATAADGTVKLTDPLAKYAPPGAKVPSFAGRQITLIDLATYTAGCRASCRTRRSRNRDRTRSRAS